MASIIVHLKMLEVIQHPYRHVWFCGHSVVEFADAQIYLYVTHAVHNKEL